MSTIYKIDHITGYGPTTEDGPGEPIIEHLEVTREELIDRYLPSDTADILIKHGTLGTRDEWKVVGQSESEGVGGVTILIDDLSIP